MGTKIKLPRYKVRALYDTIAALDGRDEDTKDGDGKATGTKRKPFDFDGKGIYALARTRDYLKTEIVAMDAVQQQRTAGIHRDLPSDPDARRIELVNRVADANEELRQAGLKEKFMEGLKKVRNYV